jgi:hypothetical protein
MKQNANGDGDAVHRNVLSTILFNNVPVLLLDISGQVVEEEGVERAITLTHVRVKIISPIHVQRDIVDDVCDILVKVRKGSFVFVRGTLKISDIVTRRN